MRRPLSLIGLVTVLILGACAHRVTTIYGDGQTMLYSPGLVPYVTRSGEIDTIIRGNPFGPGPVADPEAIAASLQPPGWYAPFRFTTRPMPGRHTDARIVMIFNPIDRSSGDDDVCRAPQLQPIYRGGGPIRLQAALCIGNRYVSHLAAMGPPASGPQDPAFRNLMDQTMTSLLPPIGSQDIASYAQGGFISR